jgi:Sulfotransferase domain
MIRILLDWREYGQIQMMIGQMLKNLIGPYGLDEAGMKRFFTEYHENLRKIVPKERLLEMQIQDGYKPLCEFLDVPVPTMKVGEKEVEQPFPKVNEGAIFVERLEVIIGLSNRRIAKKVGTFTTVLAVLGAGLWYLRRG